MSSTAMLGMIGMWETVAILAVVLILFGARKLPELAKGLGSGIKEFRKATKEVNDDLQRAFDGEDDYTPPTPPRKIPKKEETVSQSESTESKS